MTVASVTATTPTATIAANAAGAAKSTTLNTSLLSQAETAIGRTATSSDGSVSGVIASVAVNSSGATATLTNGQTVSLASGVTIS